MTEKEDKERIRRLENTVKHLILTKQDDEALADYLGDTKQHTLEVHLKKEQEHKSVFKKFLQSITK